MKAAEGVAVLGKQLNKARKWCVGFCFSVGDAWPKVGGLGVLRGFMFCRIVS